VLLLTDDPNETRSADPNALIEEARQLQRKRAARRNMVVLVAASLVILGLGATQLVQGRSSTAAQASPSGAAGAPTVTYKKIVSQYFGPHLWIKKQTVQVWSSSATPNVVRAIVTFPGHGHGQYEFGLVYKSPELVSYYYDAPTNTIYRIGSTFGPIPLPPPGQALRNALATPGARLERTRTYAGRSIYIVLIKQPHDPVVTKQTLYLDKRTHEIVRSDLVFTDNRPENTPKRVLDQAQQRTLPATKANLALTSLQTAHPGARIARVAPPRIPGRNGASIYSDSLAYYEMLMR
jgi:hypothetical protein